MKKEKIVYQDGRVLVKEIQGILYEFYKCDMCGRYVYIDDIVHCYNEKTGKEEFICVDCLVKEMEKEYD